MKKLLLVIFLLSFFNISFISDPIHKERKQNIILFIEKPQPITITKIKYKQPTSFSNFDTTYISVIESIKQFEGLRLNSYMCPANQKTIGYGHYVKSTDNISDTITLTQADNLLKEDFNHAVTFVKEYLEGLPIENKNVKILALAHFAFNVGVGTLEKSNILQLIKDNKPIDNELLKYVHYKDKNKNLIESDYLKRIRQYEVDLFNRVS